MKSRNILRITLALGALLLQTLSISGANAASLVTSFPVEDPILAGELLPSSASSLLEDELVQTYNFNLNLENVIVKDNSLGGAYSNNSLGESYTTYGGGSLISSTRETTPGNFSTGAIFNRLGQLQINGAGTNGPLGAIVLEQTTASNLLTGIYQEEAQGGSVLAPNELAPDDANNEVNNPNNVINDLATGIFATSAVSAVAVNQPTQANPQQFAPRGFNPISGSGGRSVGTRGVPRYGVASNSRLNRRANGNPVAGYLGAGGKSKAKPSLQDFGKLDDFLSTPKGQGGRSRSGGTIASLPDKLGETNETNGDTALTPRTILASGTNTVGKDVSIRGKNVNIFAANPYGQGRQNAIQVSEAEEKAQGVTNQQISRALAKQRREKIKKERKQREKKQKELKKAQRNLVEKAQKQQQKMMENITRNQNRTVQNFNNNRIR